MEGEREWRLEPREEAEVTPEWGRGREGKAGRQATGEVGRGI